MGILDKVGGLLGGSKSQADGGGWGAIPLSEDQTKASDFLSGLLDRPAPLQNIADLSELEKFIQELTARFSSSGPSEYNQTAMDLAKKTATQDEDITKRPEIQGLMKEIQEMGSLEANRLGRGMQISGSAGTSKGRDVLGRSGTDTQQKLLSSLSPYLESERNRQFSSIGLMSDLQNAMNTEIMQKIQTGSIIGEIPRQIEDARNTAKFNQDMFPFDT